MNRSKDTAVEVIGLSKHYGSVLALHAVSFTIASGQYFVLLGPSGCGKTTLLRLIGGFSRPSSGRILLHGEDVGTLPPNKRPTSMVFQNYALFPHMSVARNIGYGLTLRKKLPKTQIRARVERMLELVGLEGYATRMPHELSGGQQQRVQLARALILESDILLLDEPLASLDAKLRKDMCIELKRIQEKVGITFIHVTHNQEEAMTIAERIAILAEGEMIEEGTAQEIYEKPVKRFTAEFIGDNNLLDGQVVATSTHGVSVDLGFAKVEVVVPWVPVHQGDSVSISIRSELLHLLPAETPVPEHLQSIPAQYLEAIYLGLTTSHLVRLPQGGEVAVRRLSEGQPTPDFAPGQAVKIVWDAAHARLHTS